MSGASALYHVSSQGKACLGAMPGPQADMLTETPGMERMQPTADVAADPF